MTGGWVLRELHFGLTNPWPCLAQRLALTQHPAALQLSQVSLPESPSAPGKIFNMPSRRMTETAGIALADERLPPPQRRRSMPLVSQILLGLIAGIILGGVLNEFPTTKAWLVPNLLQPVGDLFIRIIKLVVLPLVFLFKDLAVAHP